MATLDRWKGYLSSPSTIAFPRLELIGADGEPPIVVGQGEVRSPSLSEFTFTLTGMPADIGYALSALNRHRKDPYNSLARLRLIGTDRDQVEWSLGWTEPRVDPFDTHWNFSGGLNSLCPHDKSDTISVRTSTEVIYVIPSSHPMAAIMGALIPIGSSNDPSLREHVIEVLGSTIRFTYDVSARTLSITCPHSQELKPPYLENWLGEPFRILFGQLVYPRLVARNFGNGKSSVWIRRSPRFVDGASWAALWNYRSGDKISFWNSYADILRFVALARDENGSQNFEANPITQLYEEIVQASGGSRWVWALTFASGIESLVKMLIANGSKRSDAEEQRKIEQVIQHIAKCQGDARLKEIAIRAVRRTAEVTPAIVLRELVRENIVTPDQLSAWNAIRNSTVHGKILSPYSDEIEDTRLIALGAMMHAITHEVIQRAISNPSTTMH